MKKILDLRGCTTLTECRRVLGKKRPDYILVDNVWLKAFCPTEFWTYFRGIELVKGASEKRGLQ